MASSLMKHRKHKDARSSRLTQKYTRRYVSYLTPRPLKRVLLKHSGLMLFITIVSTCNVLDLLGQVEHQAVPVRNQVIVCVSAHWISIKTVEFLVQRVSHAVHHFLVDFWYMWRIHW
jgi:hypothetical protein